MDRDDREALASVLCRNIYGGEDMAFASRMADYAIAQDAALSAQPAQAIMAGNVTFGTAE
jgi:hypothetical protein